MFTSICVRLRSVLVVSALSMALAAGAEAATVNLTSFNRSDLVGAQKAHDDFLSQYTVKSQRSETFGDKAAWNGSTGTTNPRDTSVGSFTTLGGTGSGASHINGGTGLEVRGDNNMN